MYMNIPAIIVGALINMFVGFLWYSPVLFAKQWMKLIKKTEKDLKKGNMSMMYGTTFVMALLLSFMFMYFTNAFHIATVSEGIGLGFLLWLGFVVTTTISDYIFSGRPMKLYAINIGYYLVVMILVGGLFGVWH